ncbi:hypothetical protein EHM92_00770 [bacterium]|nr:MAG: hypothetical protein EHM92_00770 [bacterium]
MHLEIRGAGRRGAARRYAKRPKPEGSIDFTGTRRIDVANAMVFKLTSNPHARPMWKPDSNETDPSI